MGQDEMISAWGAVDGLKKVLVMSTPGAVLTPWSKDIDGILLNFMPGQAMGDAIANTLFGDSNPSGKLPLTLPNEENEQRMTISQYPGLDHGENATYSETFYFGYRWYDKHNVQPKFPFGHGLSYSKFLYDASTFSIKDRTVEIDVKNVGSLPGGEVVQLYVGFPSSSGEPVRQLKGFEKYFLDAGETVTASFTLTDRDLSIWDVTSHEWALQKGEFTIEVGTSSRAIRATGLLEQK